MAGADVVRPGDGGLSCYTDPKAIAAAATRIAGFDGVHEVYSVSGEWDLVAVVRGELDQHVGFMQGRVKVTGNIGRMLSVMPVTTSPEWRAAASRVLAGTELPT